METKVKEKGSEYYDSIYKEALKYSRHYTKSKMYLLYLKASNLILPEECILEIGCGTGQFAHLLHDERKIKYLGLDFSAEAISKCRDIRMKKLQFKLQDIYTYDWDYPYDVVVILETLEHLKDTTILKKLTKGKKIILSVPDFPCESHLRYFDSFNEIVMRYNKYIKFDFGITINHRYLMKGTIK